VKTTIETYSGKLREGKSELIRTEQVEVPDLELTPEQQEIQALKARVATLEAKLP